MTMSTDFSDGDGDGDCDGDGDGDGDLPSQCSPQLCLRQGNLRWHHFPKEPRSFSEINHHRLRDILFNNNIQCWHQL